MCKIDNRKLLYEHRELNPMLYDNLEGWDGVREKVQDGGDMCVLVANLCCCIAEINTIL